MALQQALGRRYHTEHYVLAGLDRFLARHTAAGFNRRDLCGLVSHAKPSQARRPARSSPDGAQLLSLPPTDRSHSALCRISRYFPRPISPSTRTCSPRPRLSDCSTRAACLKPIPRAPLRAAVFRLAIILLYTTGLRRGELLRLVIGDYDPRAQTLLIRASKFHKSRYLVLAPDGAREVEQYLQVASPPSPAD